MATTTNFGFETPDDTDLVKDGALAIRTALDDVDGRFGNVATYPNQIVNVVSGVSRPVAYAMAAGTASITGTASVTFPAGRFTQVPLVVSGLISTSNAVGITSGTPTTSGVTFYSWNATNTANANARTVNWYALQMTSANASG